MAVRFKLDENLPRDAEALLGEAGHDVQTVLEERLNTLALLRGALVVLETESVQGRLWIIEPGQVRIRE